MNNHSDVLTPWATGTTGLTPESLHSLFRNELGAIRVPAFAAPDECDSFAAAAERHGFDFYENVYPPIGRIGITQFELSSTREKYFSLAGEATEHLESISRASFSPLQRVVASLAALRCGDVNIAYEPGRGPYFAGLIRQIRRALLHVDFGPLDGPGWAIGSINAQLAWNIYLQVPDAGGSCVVYNRRWTEADEAHKIEDSYAYDRTLVQNAEFVEVKPEAGELVIFNSRNFHEVWPTEGTRITVSSFIGLGRDGQMHLWS